jgi:NADP-dependent 3-hydroxy acid dehydrogenase YdfG
MSQNPQKKPVIAVVGAGAGIGEAVARRFAAEGFAVALYARREDSLRMMASGISADHTNSVVRYYTTDSTIESSVISSFQRSEAELGPVDVLVYNVGVRRVNGRSILETSSEEFESFMKANLLGAFWATKAVVPNMLAAGKGTILFTGATGGVRGSPKLSSFSPSKFGLRALSQIITREYAAKGVHAAHIIVDTLVDGTLIGGWSRRKWAREGEPEKLDEADTHLSRPVDLAEIYWFLYTQPRSAWTQELDVRAQKVGMFSNI